MRYVVVKKENSSPKAIIWSKSQHQIPVKQGITRECSHRDYLRENGISFSSVTSIGMIYYNPSTGAKEMSVLLWDTPAPPEDSDLVQKELDAFYKKYPELKDEILKDWNEYKAWQKYAQELLEKRK